MPNQNSDWLSVSVAEKIPEHILLRQPGLIQQSIQTLAKGLSVQIKPTTYDGWLKIAVRGDDSEVFTNLLRKDLGTAPVEFGKIKKWDVVKGFITSSGRVGYGVYVDLGIKEPSPKDALYPLHRMRAQLADGKQDSAREIQSANALVDYVPVEVLVTEIEGDRISVELADSSYERLMNWHRYPFDRLVAVGITKHYLETTIRQMGLTTDVVEVGQLSLFVQQVAFKIGTQAPGMIAKMGSRLRGVGLAAYRTQRKVD